MDGVEEDEGGEHEGGVEDVLVCFVDGDAGFVAVGVFGQAEDDADLEGGRVSLFFKVFFGGGGEVTTGGVGGVRLR